MNKDDYIAFFREHKFNCFPIPQYPHTDPEPKRADSRYQGSRTVLDQKIKSNENYGIIPTMGNGIIDFDNKELYRNFAEHMIKKGFMVIETPNGWHIPFEGIPNFATKIKLYDYAVNEHKQIIEIQGKDHYVMGCGCDIFNVKTSTVESYKNVGSMKIWDAKGKDFHIIIDDVCRQCNVVPQRRSSRSSHKNFRDRFLAGKPPTKGTSNDYFYNAAIQCNTDGITREEATTKIQNIYNMWTDTNSFSNRPWQNIESKINEVYDNDQKIEEGRPKGGGGKIDREQIATRLISERKIYSDTETGNVFENKDGFLELINNKLQKDLQKQYPALEQADYSDIVFKIKGLADDIPPTNKDLIVFKNGVFDIKRRTIIETDDIADMGFKNYEYLPCHKENHPVKFLKVVFGDVPDIEIPRIKAGLKGILKNTVDPRISIIHGKSGVGKSTPLTILTGVLGDEYALTVDLQQFLTDHFIKAHIENKRLLVFQDMPKEWKDFMVLKTITGENKKTERGFHQDKVTFDNKLKIWASGNYLAEIPDIEKDAMYSRRLSLVHNIREVPHKENMEFADEVIKEEAEKIVSWIVNLPDTECEYEHKDIVQREWESIASPEIEYIEKYWDISDDGQSEVSVSRLVKQFKSLYQMDIAFDVFIKSLKKKGYAVHNNLIRNIEMKPQPKEVNPQEKL